MICYRTISRHLMLTTAMLAIGPTACALPDAADAPPGEAFVASDTQVAGDPPAESPAGTPDALDLLASGASVDLNGDGRADVCGRGAGGIWCGLSTGTSFSPMTLWIAGFDDRGGWTAPQFYSTIQFPDVNGDGLADVCGRAAAGIACGLSNGTSFSFPTLWTAGFSDADGWARGPQYYATIRFPDINGDGRADVCGRSGNGMLCALSTGAGFTTPNLWVAEFNDLDGWGTGAQYYGTLQFPDINGDGRADVCGRGVAGIVCAPSTGASFSPSTIWTPAFADAGGWAAPQYYATLRFPDVNGDGRSDVCARGIGGIFCGLSTGAAFAPPTGWIAGFDDAGGWNQQKYYTTIQFADVNGEGRADVCGRSAGGMVCALSTGTSFVLTPTEPWSSDFSDAGGWGSGPWYYATIRLPDVNGDGRADVCGRGIGGVVCALSTAASFTPAIAPVWASTYSDANGWAGGPQYYGTIQFP